MTKPRGPRVIVIGGGIVGVSAAWYLAKRSIDVVLLEKNTVGSMASGVNFGGLRMHNRDLPEMPLSLRAHEFWKHIQEHVGHHCDVEFTGHCEMTADEKKLAVMEAWARDARQFGVQAELLSPTQLKERYPYLGGKLAGGYLVRTDGNGNPRLAPPYIARAAQQMGAVIREHTGVTHVEHDGQQFRVQTNGGEELRADFAINCAGAWAGKIAEDLGDVTPWLTMAPQMVVSEPIPYRIQGVLDVEFASGRSVYMRQIPRGNVVWGKGPGRWDLEAERAFVIPQNYFNSSNVALELVPFLKHYHMIRTWSGIEAKMPDLMPVIDWSPRVPGLLHAFGLSGHGFQLGPGIGVTLAELIAEGRTATDISGLRIGRFKDRQTSGAPVSAPLAPLAS